MLNLPARCLCCQSCLEAIWVMCGPRAGEGGNAVVETIEAEHSEGSAQTHPVALRSAGQGIIGLAGSWNPWNAKASGNCSNASWRIR